MTDYGLKEIVVCFKVSQSKLDEYEQSWRGLGFKNRSEFFRQCADRVMSKGPTKHAFVNVTTIAETNIHLDRVASTINEVNIRSFANDDQEHLDALMKMLDDAFKDLKSIRRAVNS